MCSLRHQSPLDGTSEGPARSAQALQQATCPPGSRSGRAVQKGVTALQKQHRSAGAISAGSRSKGSPLRCSRASVVPGIFPR
jgi:hypothetical protein